MEKFELEDLIENVEKKEALNRVEKLNKRRKKMNEIEITLEEITVAFKEGIAKNPELMETYLGKLANGIVGSTMVHDAIKSLTNNKKQKMAEILEQAKDLSHSIRVLIETFDAEPNSSIIVKELINTQTLLREKVANNLIIAAGLISFQNEEN